MSPETIRQFLSHLPPSDDVPGWIPGDHIAGLAVSDGRIVVALAALPDQAPKLEAYRAEVENVLRTLPDIVSVQVVLTSERAASEPTSQPEPQSAPRVGQHPTEGKIVLPGVRRMIAVASGKGGVGKSTTTANLAMSFAAMGLRVGILDADIYGPSIPHLFGCADAQPMMTENRQMMPIERFGVRLISIGFLVPPDAPVIWRGPMVSGAVEQLFRDVAWGELDVLLLDLPPGTGDAQLTMTQKAPLSGAVIVSTPQDLALIDAKRALAMFRKVDTPVLGIIENMSYYECPNCGHREHIFAHGGAAAAAEDLQTRFLGAVPLTLAIREASDAGTPIVAAAPDSPQALAYRAIAETLWAEQTDKG